jgi:multimeric flavodoxin WrbA
MEEITMPIEQMKPTESEATLKSRKKVLVIMGSPRKGNSYAACEAIRKKMESMIQCDFEYLWLKDANLLPCRGCLLCCCKGEETCPNRDDAPQILKKMTESDGVIFAVPVYVMNVSGLMKTFLDRFGYLGHRQRFFDKKAIVLVNTASGGLKSVLNYMDRIIRVWGFEVVSNVAFLAPPDPNSSNPSLLDTENLDGMLSNAADSFSKSFTTRRKSPGLYETAFFHVWRAIASLLEKYYPRDFEFWKAMGWFEPGKKFFTDVRVNPFYVGLGKIYGWISWMEYKKRMNLFL